MKLTTLDKLFHRELKDVYDAEHQIIKALPKFAAGSSNPELTTAFKKHLSQTEEHITRLASVFEEIGESPSRELCAGMKGLIEEGSKMLAEDADPVVKDAALISAAQRVEHYEMAAYGTLRTWARILGYQESARLLEETLDEEKETDSALTGIATSINPEAAAGDETGKEASERGSRESGRKTTPAESGTRSQTGTTTRKPGQRPASKSTSRR